MSDNTDTKTILKNLKNFYNLPYFFESHEVILGDKSCIFRDEYICEEMEYFNKAQNKMLDLYEKEYLSDTEKKELGDRMDKLISQCKYRHSSFKNLKDQELYLTQFSPDILEKIFNQINMYKTALRYYQEYSFNRN